jgi:hypothetical protein
MDEPGTSAPSLCGRMGMSCGGIEAELVSYRAREL